MTEAATASRRLILIATVALIGLNLRPFITAIGPLAGNIRLYTGLGLQSMALLTLIPMLLMGLVAFAGPTLENAIGSRRSIVGALLVIGAGCALRLLAASGWMIIATAAVIGLGVALIQAVFPGIVKREFPRHVGPVMGLYSAMLMGGGALGALVSPIIAGASGNWAMGLACFAIPAIAASILALRFLPADAEARPGQRATRAFLARPRTWLLMACFGLVNGGYSSAVAWLAPAYQELGWSAADSGGLLAVMAVSQAAAALTLPILAGKMPDRRPWLWLTLAMQAAGFMGLVFAPGLVPFALAAILGAGLGGCFALSLVVALDHLPDPSQAGALSAFMQGGGFIVASLPAWIVAALHDATGGYAAGWIWHLASVAIVACLTVRLAPGSYARAMPALHDAIAPAQGMEGPPKQRCRAGLLLHFMGLPAAIFRKTDSRQDHCQGDGMVKMELFPYQGDRQQRAPDRQQVDEQAGPVPADKLHGPYIENLADKRRKNDDIGDDRPSLHVGKDELSLGRLESKQRQGRQGGPQAQDEHQAGPVHLRLVAQSGGIYAITQHGNKHQGIAEVDVERDQVAQLAAHRDDDHAYEGTGKAQCLRQADATGKEHEACREHE